MDDRVGQLVTIDHGFELAAPDPPFASLSQRPTRTAYRSMRPVYPSPPLNDYRSWLLLQHSEADSASTRCWHFQAPPPRYSNRLGRQSATLKFARPDRPRFRRPACRRTRAPGARSAQVWTCKTAVGIDARENGPPVPKLLVQNCCSRQSRAKTPRLIAPL